MLSSSSSSWHQLPNVMLRARPEHTGLAGTRTWCWHGIFAHNLIRISGLID